MSDYGSIPSPNPIDDTGSLALSSLLRWHLDVGVDETIGNHPTSWYTRQRDIPGKRAQNHPVSVSGQDTTDNPTRPVQYASPLPNTPLADIPGLATETAAHIVLSCHSLEDLRTALESFEGCPLKQTATNTVFGDGTPEGLMVIGEAPGRDEDRLGRPFVGQSGQLLDRMLASISETRETFYITNVLPWRPPGNRVPTDSEVAVCLPFLERHIELVRPRLLLLVGGLSARTLFSRPEGIMRLRGRWHEYQTSRMQCPIPAIATYHPAYLLRNPAQKRMVWRDLLELQAKIRTLSDRA